MHIGAGVRFWCVDYSSASLEWVIICALFRMRSSLQSITQTRQQTPIMLTRKICFCPGALQLWCSSRKSEILLRWLAVVKTMMVVQKSMCIEEGERRVHQDSKSQASGTVEQHWSLIECGEARTSSWTDCWTCVCTTSMSIYMSLMATKLTNPWTLWKWPCPIFTVSQGPCSILASL